jgi:hypothetical protein
MELQDAWADESQLTIKVCAGETQRRRGMVLVEEPKFVPHHFNRIMDFIAPAQIDPRPLSRVSRDVFCASFIILSGTTNQGFEHRSQRSRLSTAVVTHTPTLLSLQQVHPI